MSIHALHAASSTPTIINSDSSDAANTLMEKDPSGAAAAKIFTVTTKLVLPAGLVMTPSPQTAATVTASGEACLYTCNTGSNTITVNLPAAAGCTGQVIGVKKTSASNSLIVDPNSSELIDGAGTLTATAIQAALLFYSDGTGWQTITRQGSWS